MAKQRHSMVSHTNMSAKEKNHQSAVRICWSKKFISPLTRDFGFVRTRGTGFWPLVAEGHEEVLTEVFREVALQKSLHEDLKALKVNLLWKKKENMNVNIMLVMVISFNMEGVLAKHGRFVRSKISKLLFGP